MASWNSFPLLVTYEALGWFAFFSWSISFYFQVILNFRRKSVVGLNFDFVLLNLTKQSSYLIYNASLYFSSAIQKQYFEKYGYGEMIPVAANDVAFSSHAVLLLSITLFQIAIYDRGGQKLSKISIGIVSVAWLTAAVCFFIALSNHSWLWLLSIFKAALMSMFSSNDWKSSKFASSQDGKKVQNMVLDSRFWKNIVICLRAAGPLIFVLRLVDSDEKPAMGFIYDAMDSAKEKIKANFKDVKKSYEPIWKIIDERWDNQLHRPLHAAAYYLNPQFHYEPNFRDDDFEVKQGLYNCLARMVDDPIVRNKILGQLPQFHYAESGFGTEAAKSSRKNMLPGVWWDFHGDGCRELKRFAIRVLSLTCSSSGCERNWSSFEMVHTKRRNRLLQKKMNDLVYVMYNTKLTTRQLKRNLIHSFDDIQSDDEWITEAVEVEDNDEQQPPRDEVNEVGNVDIVGDSGNPTSNNLDLENLIFDPNIDDPISSEEEEEEFDDDNDDDSSGDGDEFGDDNGGGDDNA